MVSEVRAAESDRLHGVMASAAAQADAGLPGRLVGLLDVPDGSRVSEMERLRRSPVRASAPQMVRSLDRASELLAIGAGKTDVAGVPANRVDALARYGLGTKAPTLRGLTEPDGHAAGHRAGAGGHGGRRRPGPVRPADGDQAARVGRARVE